MPLEERRQRDHSSEATSSINTKMLWSKICSWSENASAQGHETSTHTKLGGGSS